MNYNGLNNPKRITWIDWAKVIMLSLVCIMHFTPPENEYRKLIWWGFLMPAFFFISGYLYKRNKAWKTLVLFLIPVCFYSLITFGVHIIQDIAVNGSWNYKLDLCHPWYRMIGQFFVIIKDNPYGEITIFVLWFIIALIVCRLLAGDFKIFSFVTRYRYWALGILLVWLTIEPLIWEDFPLKHFTFYYGIYAMPFFLTGYIYKELDFKIECINPLLAVAALVMYFAITLNLPSVDMRAYQCGSTYILFYITSMCGSLCFFLLCSKLPRSKTINVLAWGTLLILMMHSPIDYFIVAAIYKVGIYPTSSNMEVFLISWIRMLIVFAICYYPISWLSSHMPILLGKMKKRKV